MEKKRARKNHILPKSFLRNFASKDEKIFTLDFEQKKVFESHIDQAAIITDFYTVKTIDNEEDDCIEQGFLSKFEGFINVIDAIVETKQLPRDLEGRNKLINYMALMYVRGPRFRQILFEIYDAFARKMNKDLTEDENQFNAFKESFQKDKGISFPFDFQQARDMASKVNISVEIPRTYYIEQMMKKASDLVFPLGRMTQNLFYIPFSYDYFFITADMPIIPVHNGNWLKDKNAWMVFPISSKCCIVLDYDRSPKVCRIVSCKQIASINGWTACNCSRMAFSQKDKFIWRDERGGISDDMRKLIDFLGPEKKNQPLTQPPFQGIETKCFNDWNLLKSDDQ